MPAGRALTDSAGTGNRVPIAGGDTGHRGRSRLNWRPVMAPVETSQQAKGAELVRPTTRVSAYPADEQAHDACADPTEAACLLALAHHPLTDPWRLAGAALVDSTGEQVELADWQEAPIPAKCAGAVVVGIEGDRAQLGCPCTLKLWEAQGPRTVTLGNVTFPVSQKAGP